MPLFGGDTKVTDFVKAEDVRMLTGISASDFHFENQEDPEKALDELLNKWIEQIASHIHVRLGRTVDPNSDEALAIKDILLRTVAKLVAVAQQQRSSPVIQIGDFAVSILNTAEVTKDLNSELMPFKKSRISIFSSADCYEEDGYGV